MSASANRLFNSDMKTTRYFDFIRDRPDRIGITDDWIQEAVEFCDAEEIQEDGRIRRWLYIREQGKYLRVVLLEDGETVHNAFFDRRFKR